MKKRILKIINKFWPFLLIIGLGFIVSWPLMRYGYFSHQDDLHIIRIFEMRRCFSDLQIPCRWTPDMGWGNGSPVFNFYGVFLYYLAGILSYLVGFIVSAKIIFYISLVAGSIGMYLLVKDIWGKTPGVVSSVLYMFAPYKALDAYVRGALAESFALALAPFVFYFGYKLVTSEKPHKYGVFFSLFLFGFMITHNIMLLIFLPILGLWLLYWLVSSKWNNIQEVVLYSLFGAGLSLFFILPAFFEKNLVQSESLVRFELDFRANYLKVSQLFFDRVWGYGTSIPGPEGGMNFQVGWPHWLLALCSLVLLLSKKVKKGMKVLIFSIFGVFVLSLFMTHNKSTFIWVNISLLKYFQFPWRFLSLSIFTASILGGLVVSVLKKRWQILISVFIIIATVLLNWQYFKPREFYAISDTEKLTGVLWEQQEKGALLDYLPKTALEPREKAPTTLLVISGKATVNNFTNRSGSWEAKINVAEAAVIEVPVFYFPNWQVYIDGNKYPFSYDNVLGRISFALEPGEYTVIGKFENTPIRTVGNTLTLLSAAGLVAYVIYAKNRKISK